MKRTENVQLDKERKIESLVEVSLDKIRSLIDVNCVIGSAITMPNGSVIIPVSKVSVGFVAGGGEFNDLNAKRNSADFPMAGGTGGGFTVSPIGFFVADKEKFKLVHAEKSSEYLSLLKSATDVLKNLLEKQK